MKKLISLIIIATVFASCSKKSDDTATPTGNTTLMIGKWKDGGETDLYYKNGKLVYTGTIAAAAPANSPALYQFNSDGTFTVSILQGNGSYLLSATYTGWVLTDSNTYLHYVSGSTVTDKPISFSNNNNTAVLTTNSTNSVTYTDNSGATQSADSETTLSTILRK